MSASDPFGELDQRLASTLEDTFEELRDRMLGRLREATREAQDLARAAKAEPSGTERLLGAVAEVARAETQSTILGRLAEGARRFADRAAVFVIQVGRIQGWTAAGFGDANQRIEELELGFEEDGLFARLAGGHGTLVLDAGECADLCARLDAEEPASGVLVPLVLRDRIAGALYADRLGEESEDGGGLDLAALQLLTHAAAQAVETLPLRESSFPATLVVADEYAAEALPLWEAPAEPAAEVAVEPEPQPEPEPVAEPEFDLEPEPAAEPAAEAELEPESMPLSELEPESAPAGELELESDAEVEEADVERVSVIDPLPGIPLEGEHAEPEAFSSTPLAEPELEEPIEDRSGDATEVSFAGAEDVPELGEPPLASKPAEVSAPPGIQGPGTAFRDLPSVGDTNGDVQAQDAQRLARLLVSEIKLYNQEVVEEGRRQRDIYSRLREDIERSRRMYEERVDEPVREATDYFHQELVRILADGDPTALGN